MSGVGQSKSDPEQLCFGGRAVAGHDPRYGRSLAHGVFGGNAISISGSNGVQIGNGNVMSVAGSGVGAGVLRAASGGCAFAAARGPSGAAAATVRPVNNTVYVAAGVAWPAPVRGAKLGPRGGAARPGPRAGAAKPSAPPVVVGSGVRTTLRLGASGADATCTLASTPAFPKVLAADEGDCSSEYDNEDDEDPDANQPGTAPIPIPMPRRREGESAEVAAALRSSDSGGQPQPDGKGDDLVPGGPSPVSLLRRVEREESSLAPGDQNPRTVVSDPTPSSSSDELEASEDSSSESAIAVRASSDRHDPDHVTDDEGFTLLVDEEPEAQCVPAPAPTPCQCHAPEPTADQPKPMSPRRSSVSSSGTVSSAIVSISTDPSLACLHDYLYAPGIRQGRFGGRGAVQLGYLGSERRCRCHAAPSRSRYCALRLGGSTGDHDLEEGLGGLWLDHLERVERCAADVMRVGSVPLYRALIGGASRLLEEDPTLDGRLARYYLRGLRGYDGASPSGYYGRCPTLRPEVRQFFVRHGSSVDATVAAVASRGDAALGRGLLATSLLVDRVGSRVAPDGRDETPLSIFCRVAVTLAADAELLCPGGMSVASGGPTDALGLFESLFRSLTAFRLVLPERTLAYLGWRGENPIFPACAYRAPPGAVAGTGPEATLLASGPEITFNGALRDILDLTSNGVSVSVAAADLTGDLIAALRILGLHCRALRLTARFPVRVCVQADIWSADVLHLFVFALDEASEFEELTFAFNVPALFWDRYLDDQCERSWTCLFRPECEGLSRLSPTEFREVYERRERLPASGLSVSVWWLLSSLDACVARGHTSVIFPHNVRSMYRGRLMAPPPAAADDDPPSIVPLNATPGDGASPGVAGPDMASWGDPIGLSDSPGVRPYIPVYVNLEACVMPMDDPRAHGGSYTGLGLDLDTEEDDLNGVLDSVGPRRSRPGTRDAGGAGRVFSFALLRDAVRDAVLVGNLLLDACLRDNPYGAGDAVALLRPLQISPIGFQAALNRLGLSLNDSEVSAFNRRVFETMYWTALLVSSELAGSGGGPFPRFDRTRYADGCVYPDLFPDCGASTLSPGAWDRVRDRIRRYGLRNATFICVDGGEEAARLAETTPGTWPRRANLRYERSPLLSAASRDEALASGLAAMRQFKVNATVPLPDDSTLLRLASPRPVYLPMINRLFDTVGRARVAAALGRRRRAAGSGLESGPGSEPCSLSFQSPNGDADVAFETAAAVSSDVLLRLAVERRGFVDQPQSLPVYVTGERSVAQLSSHLRRAHALELAVGVHRCYLLPAVNR